MRGMLALLVIFSTLAPHALPPLDFFVMDGQPRVILVVPRTASARDILLVSSVASHIGRLASREEVSERVVWQSERLTDYLFYNDDGTRPPGERFGRGNLALGYTGVAVSLGVGGTTFIAEPSHYGEYDYVGANSVDGDWSTATYLASGSFYFWPDDNYFSLEFVEDKVVDRIILAVGHIGNYRLQYGSYDASCSTWTWGDIPDLHEGDPAGPPPPLDFLGNIVGNPAGFSVRKYFFSPFKTRALRLLMTPADMSGIPHKLHEFQVYGEPFSVLYSSHYSIDFTLGSSGAISIPRLDYWITGIKPTQFSDFMETRGHSWKAPPNGYSLFDRDINPLRLYRNPQSNEPILLFGIPRTHSFTLLRGASVVLDGWTVRLDDVDAKNHMTSLTVCRGLSCERAFIRERPDRKVSGELFVDASQNGEERETMYLLDSVARDGMVLLEFHPDPADPLHDTVLNASQWWHTQNSTSRAHAYWTKLVGAPPLRFPFAVFDGILLEEERSAFGTRLGEAATPPCADLVLNGDVDGRFLSVSGSVELGCDFSSAPTHLVLKYIIYERNVMHDGSLHDYVVRGIVEEADTVFQNHSPDNWWDYHELRTGEKYLFSRVFDLQDCDWAITIDEPRNVGVAVLLQKYGCSLCPSTYDIPGEVLASSAYDEMRGDVFSPYVVDTHTNYYPTYEVVEDLDLDGERDDVVFAVEAVTSCIGDAGVPHATFKAYTLMDAGILTTACCYASDDGALWDLFVSSDGNPSDIVSEGALRVTLRDALPVSCEGRGTLSGPARYFRLVLEGKEEKREEEAALSEHHEYAALRFFLQRVDVVVVAHASRVDPATLLRFDDELSERERASANLILFGKGNALVRRLQEEGMTKVDWESSSGEMEYLPGTWGVDVLVVAGRDESAMHEAALLLAQYLEGLLDKGL